MENEKIFCDRLKALRTAKCLSQQQVAEQIGITRVGFQNYEVGRRKPTFEMIIVLADFFGVSADYLLGRSDKP